MLATNSKLRIVTKETELEFDLEELHLTPNSPDSAILTEARRVTEQTLNNYTVTRHEINIIVSPTPTFG